MKKLLVLSSLLVSINVFADEQNGYVRNVITDDEGVKVILSSTPEPVAAKDVTTIHISNQQANFEKIQQVVKDLKSARTPVTLKKDTLNTVSVK